MHPQRDFTDIAVIGAGAWGTALAITAARAGRRVRLWAREPDVAAAVEQDGENTPFLPGHTVPADVSVTADMAKAVHGADLMLLVVPSQFLRRVAAEVQVLAPAGVPVVICSKGIERDSGKLMSAIVEEEMPGRRLAVLSGPTFAEEVAAGLPSAVTVASVCAGSGHGKQSLAARIAVAFGSATFRPYISDDVIGVEVGGAVKNVLAIACGIATGLGFRSNTRAALITRGLDEMKSLAETLGGRRETVTGLAGIGDLMLTCSSEQSRNMSFGLALGCGKSRDEILAGKAQVVEGVVNSGSVTGLARQLGLEMPICEAVHAVVEQGMDVGDALAALLGRPLKAEPKALNIALPHPAAKTIDQEIAALAP
ncbi:NAD(P)H-dependent glycerol-3-phosphate dehydrogenase [Pelagibius sp. 7325]|uniref:NAD(P)H-dependent glycerol-3-phosphate dehydrogenase n=1 Tax=Pelagibius sp. 7325 TaxID=3131994 RepID=UPI0030EE1BA5